MALASGAQVLDAAKTFFFMRFIKIRPFVIGNRKLNKQFSGIRNDKRPLIRIMTLYARRAPADARARRDGTSGNYSSILTTQTHARCPFNSSRSLVVICTLNPEGVSFESRIRREGG
ncbi:hypothetical protein EVAR_44804_1 [Eumeta japonica]|uniref:Uncharacterized protein n=1 Tax=Eumeta variegata TaxID=151549 RepID=A0A4C1X725_EUMVA|nr:hypothetical protein EVAR_44804_1 [Eumeta japonica]